MRKTTAVSYEGDKAEVDALGQLASEQGMTVGRFVATAVREKYGTDLESLASFFRKRGSQKRQSVNTKSNGVEHV